MAIPVKPISEIEVKSEVSENDKILILDSDTEEARLASKDELKWEDGRDGRDWTDAWQYMTQEQYNALPSSKNTDHVSRMVFSDEEFYFKTLLRASNNLLHYNNNDELYADLQFIEWVTPTSIFPIWITVWNVNSRDWWQVSWLLVNARTENKYMRWLYWDDNKLYFDWWTWVFKQIATTDDITVAVWNLRNELSTVALTWKSSDLDNDAGFSSVPVMTEEEYEDTPWTASDDKRYFIYDTIIS